MTLTESIKDVLAARRELVESGYPGSGSNREESPSPQGSSQKAGFEVVNRGTGGKGGGPQRLAPGVNDKEDRPSKQGSSQEAGWEDLGSEDVGVNASTKSKETTKKPLGKGAGPSANFTTRGDARSVVNQPSSRGNVAQESITTLFAGQELSEDFKTKATGLFEALVLARVSEIQEELEAEMAEAAADEILAAEEALVEEVDKYLNYMAEQWIEENEVNIANSLQVELANSFFEGLRELYAEHYVSMPEGGTDLVSEMAARIDELTAQLDEQIEEVVEQVNETKSLRRDTVLSEGARGLALTEAEKLKTLVAGIVFEDDDSFAEKIAVIRENYFPKSPKAPLTESIDDIITSSEVITADPAMDSYVRGISLNTGFKR